MKLDHEIADALDIWGSWKAVKTRDPEMDHERLDDLLTAIEAYGRRCAVEAVGRFASNPAVGNRCVEIAHSELYGGPDGD